VKTVNRYKTRDHRNKEQSLWRINVKISEKPVEKEWANVPTPDWRRTPEKRANNSIDMI
jgi:hypothetical protein